MNIKSTNIEMERYTISQLLQKLFQELEQQKIKWCSWKSNEHIYPALIGDTDLDALFQTNDRSKVIEIMQQCGFVLFKPTAHRAYPGVLDFIATDPISGKILHVHAHFLLTLGEQHLKSYIFPWNDIILKYRIRHDEFQDTYISNYEMEIAFLLIRYSIKMRWREQIKYSIKSKFGDHDFWAEFQWLQRRVTLQKLNVFLPQILNESMTSSLLNIIDEGPNVCNMAKLREEVESTSKKNHWRRFSSAHVPFLMWKNEVKNNLVRLFDKMSFSQTIIKRRRALHGHGFVVSFMGADGSGKINYNKEYYKSVGA